MIGRGRARKASAAGSRGVSLVELLVALTIGGILIYGATKMYVGSRKIYEVNKSAARLQETARYALGVIEPDVRMSNYWGLVKGAGAITGSSRPTDPSLGAPTDCGNNFAHHLLSALEGSNNSYNLPCAPHTAAVSSADTLTVRRASIAASTPTNNRLQVCSTRVAGRLFSDGGACTAPPAGQVNDLLVNTYYVDQNSGTPSLRRKALKAGPAFSDEEITPGVEDLQVQFGIDPTGDSGTATRYVNPGAVPANAQIVSVRLWILARSEAREIGFKNDRVYEYGDRDEANGTTSDVSDPSAATRAYAPNDGFRRLLVSRTIHVRNALGT
ncbi:MAG TPA: PilW family protein [Steroidobacter sp.]|nr:PilW family protein [Steroidobacter sp.]